jgi:spoIIIJ-associated protein
MSSFEYKGKNVAKAVQLACAELKLSQDEINYQVLSYGSSGIFGLAGAKKARILVDLPENAEKTEVESEAAGFAGQGVEYCGDANVMEDQRPADNGSGDQRSSEFPENPLELGRTVLQRIVGAITSDAEISAEASSERILLNVSGGNAGKLIGKKGQTLEAIQSVVEKIVNKHNNHNNSDKIRVQVDVGGYLETKKDNLEKLAMRLADKSKRISKPISLGQMSAYDRRIVHLALKDDSGVRTQSRGEGYMRKLVIFPIKNNPRSKAD